MQIFPAIDIKDKKVVRLTFGDYDQMKIYADDPVQIAKNFCACGAKNLHVVDLDGAKDGNLANFDVIEQIAKNCGMFVQVGGGIRDEDRIKKYIDCGVGRVILGTVAVENFAFVEQMAKKYGDKIAVGVDAKDGFVAIHGWKTVTSVQSVDFCQKLCDAGVKTVIYTDISKDGGMKGTNLGIYRQLAKIDGLDVVASGGITFYDELTTLDRMGTYGAILGKALYEGLLDLKKAVELV
ncbi:MAG: 1-(5-phosphoribosyl)-5-[Clostridia bacterium]|nr:1-(5-phosphoribosyl)-5-[(5-phosphoribosylamino)methylideneamino]imidazole-4-carboxamide isomerase [Clostridia bacterium]